jgi:hypothetical protein
VRDSTPRYRELAVGERPSPKARDEVNGAHACSSIRRVSPAESDTIGVLADFANELSGEIKRLRSDFEAIKAWASSDLANRIENASNELRVEMSGLLGKSLDDAKNRAAQAELELKELESLIALPGPVKTVRLVHDADGRALGAVISDRKR